MRVDHEELPRATTRTVVFQAAAFLLYQYPAGVIANLAPGSVAAWWVALAVGAFLWTSGHRARGLADEADLMRTLGLVVLFHAALKGLPVIGAALSPVDEVLPYAMVFVLWVVPSAMGVALGLVHAVPAEPSTRRAPSAPPRSAIDTFLGPAPSGSESLPDPYEDERHTVHVD